MGCVTSIKVPTKKQGKSQRVSVVHTAHRPSMKAPPTLKGNHRSRHGRPSGYPSLNESPYEKVGKSGVTVRLDLEVVHA